MKLYLVIETNDGASGLWGEYVSLCGIYTKENLAKIRLEMLENRLNENGYIIDNSDEYEDRFIDYTNYNYKIISVNSDSPINEFLGGYAE